MSFALLTSITAEFSPVTTPSSYVKFHTAHPKYTSASLHQGQNFSHWRTTRSSFSLCFNKVALILNSLKLIKLRFKSENRSAFNTHCSSYNAVSTQKCWGLIPIHTNEIILIVWLSTEWPGVKLMRPHWYSLGLYTHIELCQYLYVEQS